MNYKYAFLGLLLTLLIAYMSSIPDWSFSSNGSLSEKIISNFAHIPAYAVLTFLWLKSFKITRFGSRHNLISFLIFLGLIVFAISDEIHQSFVPGRSASFMDIGLDLLGILLGLGAFVIFGMPNISHEK